MYIFQQKGKQKSNFIAFYSISTNFSKCEHFIQSVLIYAKYWYRHTPTYLINPLPLPLRQAIVYLRMRIKNKYLPPKKVKYINPKNGSADELNLLQLSNANCKPV
eukprot:TRINITY_DN10559_c4_g1_i2.p2 TRINITY_DN10559_c4_g1~~TRINITY_DN10559_c4_g1_i2.p2  ORF type:complete len:105 (+),score=3.98 TRINITY_DN10559_c4_g1_i2:78-392(+)